MVCFLASVVLNYIFMLCSD